MSWIVNRRYIIDKWRTVKTEQEMEKNKYKVAENYFVDKVVWFLLDL